MSEEDTKIMLDYMDMMVQALQRTLDIQRNALGDIVDKLDTIGLELTSIRRKETDG